ncbi:MarR family winged helix-turn-helix transcriptional regulator [Nocardia paucivorans]|uniref:MarR family winged helix-turn-helix transcriptional regulator n=1 Tax=Nocardia paucivorans TaxID=114259 RepID=UPI0012F7578D|nr:MarR family transcriptional regulator [Nocardia paucivorans]
MANEADVGAVVERFVLGICGAAESAAAGRLAELDLPFSQARILFLLSRYDHPLPIHAIAEELALSMTAAGRNVDRLVGLGLLTREECPTDRRVKLIGFTEDGHKVVRGQMAVHRATIDTFVHKLPDTLRDDLRAVLSAVLDSGVLTTSWHAPFTPSGDTP